MTPGFSHRSASGGDCNKMAKCFLILISLLVVGPACFSFDLPDRDPWYYQSIEPGYAFVIPDKAQHYWGSALLNEIGKKLSLPEERYTGPALALTAGFLYEAWQSSKGIGFSPRDLAADALGVATSHFNSDSFSIWMDYSTREETIMMNFATRW